MYSNSTSMLLMILAYVPKLDKSVINDPNIYTPTQTSLILTSINQIILL